MDRWVLRPLFHALRRAGSVPTAVDVDEARDSLVQRLHAWNNTAIPYCGGFAPEAWQAFEQWSRWRDSKANEAPDRVQTFFAGASTLAAKIALLYAIDQHEPIAGHGWLISYESLRKAVTVVDTLYLPSIMHLGERLALGPFERERQRILDAVDSIGKRGISRGELLRKVRMSGQAMDIYTDTLLDSGELVRSQDARGMVFKRAGNGLAIMNGGIGNGGVGGGQSGSGQAG